MGLEPELDAIDDISQQTVYCPVPSCAVNYSGPKALKRLSAHKRSQKTEEERKYFGPTSHERRFLKKNLDSEIKQEFWFLMAKYSLTGPCVENIVDFTSRIWNSSLHREFGIHQILWGSKIFPSSPNRVEPLYVLYKKAQLLFTLWNLINGEE